MKSHSMHLSGAERSWLSWWGANGRLRLAWSCWLNRHRYPLMEETFEGIANSRHRLLLQWFQSHWSLLQAKAERLASLNLNNDAGQAKFSLDKSALQEPVPDKISRELSAWRSQTSDYSELLVIDRQGKVIASSHAPHVGSADLNPAAVQRGLMQAFLHGPYSDPLTLALGPTSSRFHDAMTLMFYQPIVQAGATVGCLCGRIPNDAMSDVLQREDGHVFRDSGDNYLFLAKAGFETGLPGTALSRSRFEDGAFTLGDNLREGVKTAFGTVSIRNHTELELRFTDPATRELHPGVRETIRNGNNLFVLYPGYPDYRHIPVIGKGITFIAPGSADLWGMMCEGDLEEVYRRRPLVYRMAKTSITAAAVGCGIATLLAHAGAPISTGIIAAFSSTAALLAGFAVLLPFAARLNAQSRLLLAMAECGASLRQRLEWRTLVADEAGELGRWINSFVDKIDDTVRRNLAVAKRVETASSNLSALAAQVSDGSHHQRSSAQLSVHAIAELDNCSESMATQSTAAETIARDALTLSSRGTQVIHAAISEMTLTADTINQMARRIHSLDQRSEEINRILVVIKTIADQTNLLALNAAIEAARAGEQGRGFSVVADEVRGLAQRTANSTSEISAMIDAVQSETRAAVDMMQQCQIQVGRSAELVSSAGDTLSLIYDGANQAVIQISEIAKATRNQLAIGNKIATQVHTIAGLAEENNIQAHAALDAARDLDQLSRDLLGVVGKFSL